MITCTLNTYTKQFTPPFPPPFLSLYPVLQPHPRTANLPPSLLLLFLHLALLWLGLGLALAPTTFANGANEIPACEGQDEKGQDAGCRDIEEDHEGGEGGVEFGG